MELDLETLANGIVLMDAQGHLQAANARGRQWLVPVLRHAQLRRRIEKGEAAEMMLNGVDGQRLRIRVGPMGALLMLEAANLTEVLSEIDGLRAELREASDRIEELSAAHEELRCAYEALELIAAEERIPVARRRSVGKAAGKAV